ncbi:MAG: RdgB/HAM1 family non-canonical purine NTP pyrophosphatase [Halothiobacillaceae bacterium]|nr:RdgB/HAM1 family non-canonical purine NTP pyrophosphatase [Halothiobacillaceae bacterium]
MSGREIVLASGNPGKLREFNELFASLGESWAFRVRSQGDFGVPEVEETGLSFVENALIKARHAARHTGLPALADDSGLEVDALRGAPGIYSARFAGPGADDADNNDRLLAALAGLPAEARRARFQSVVVFMRHAEDPTPLIAQGTWEGRILEAPLGSAGFGYDPLFWVESQGASAAQLSAEIKNALSHRGQALRALAEALRARL